MSSSDLSREQQIRALLEQFQRGPLLALIASKAATGRFSFWRGLRLLRWEWRRGSFSRASANLAISERVTLWRHTVARSFVPAQYPAQVLNEFRNALTHLSRAAASIDPSIAEMELGDTRRHLERATRDSYKILAVSTHDSLIQLTRVVESKARSLPVTLYNQLRFIRDERRDILIEEHISPSGSPAYNALTDRYKRLVRKITLLEKDIRREYRVHYFDILLWGSHLGRDDYLLSPSYFFVRFSAPFWRRNTVAGLFTV